MTTKITSALVSLAVLALVPSGASAQSVDSTFSEWAGSSRTVGIAAGVIDGATTNIHVGGVATLGSDEPIATESQFVIGSVTKAFTGLLLADMVVRGELALEDPLSSHLPAGWQVPGNAERPITLLDLATHTSGLPRLGPNLNPEDPDQPYQESDLASLREGLAASVLASTPGESYTYSNFGMALLGVAMSHTAGESFEQLLRERVLTPLGMENTFVGSKDADPSRMVSGHAGMFYQVPIWDFGSYAPAGAVVSTVPDMLILARAVLNPDDATIGEAIELATTPLRMLAAGSPDSIGLAWHIRGVGEERVVWHNGATGGFRAWFGVKRGANRAAVILQNVAVPWADAIGGTLLAGRIRGTPPVVEPLEIQPLNSQERDALSGSFQLAPNVEMRVGSVGKRMTVQLTGQMALRIVATEPDRFTIVGVPAELVFERDDSGAVVAAVLHQNGREMRAPRL